MPRGERGDRASGLERSDRETKRLMRFEPTTFCMASRRSSQLSYSRAGAEYSRGPGGSRGRLDVVGGVELELEPGEAAAALDAVAAPTVGEAIDEQEAVAALRLE